MSSLRVYPDKSCGCLFRSEKGSAALSFLKSWKVNCTFDNWTGTSAEIPQNGGHVLTKRLKFQTILANINELVCLQFNIGTN